MLRVDNRGLRVAGTVPTGCSPTYRSIIIGNEVVAIGDATIVIANLASLQARATLTFGPC